MSLQAAMDIETLSTRANAVVLSIGICFFDDETWQPFEEIVENGIEVFFDQKEQRFVNRQESASTLQWWTEQGEKAQRCLNPKKSIHPREFYEVFDDFCQDRNVNINHVTKNVRWWVRGPHFDISIMDDMFADFNVTPPWKYYKVRDIRTWLECHGFEDNAKLPKPKTMIPHNALHDAAFDAYMMLQVLHRPAEEIELLLKERV